MGPFLSTVVKKIIDNKMIELNVTKQDLPCQSESEECVNWLKWYHLILQLPFEINKFPYDNLGFGTYLAYLSRYLSSKAGQIRFFNKAQATSKEQKARKVLAIPLAKLGLKSTNISIYELVNMLHMNPDETKQEKKAFAYPLQFETGCKDDIIYRFIDAWKVSKNEAPPCKHHSLVHDNHIHCCKMFQVFEKELEIVLKIMKYSIQPSSYHEPFDKFLESYDDLDFIPYRNLTRFINKPGVRQLMETNTNPRIFMCKFAKKGLLLPRQCNLFHISLTNQGIGYSFNMANYWDIFTHSRFTDLFAKIMRPKGYKTKPSEEKYYVESEDDHWPYPDEGIISPMHSGPSNSLEVTFQLVLYVGNYLTIV